MGSLRGLGISLSIVFGCILMGAVAELFYLWWKKRVAAASSTTTKTDDFSLFFCWKKPTSFDSFRRNQQLANSVRSPLEQEDLEMGSNKNLGFKGEEGVEAELMRMHNLCGPPRFLFTIKEESKEDLESEDGKSLSRKVSTVRPGSYHNHGFNPLFESLSEAEVNRLRSSPPPKFKFLKDAEDKLIRKLLMEEYERKRGLKNEESAIEDVSFVRFATQAVQVLPLASSPTFRAVLG